jgi:hypothetical protein
MKACNHCKIVKPLEDYYPNKACKDGRQGKCKACELERKRQVRKENPIDHKAKHLKHRYGITMADYERMYEEQEGVCAVCQTAEANVVDHNHETGEVRGLLCNPCNRALGYLKDKPINAIRAFHYLTERGSYG